MPPKRIKKSPPTPVENLVAGKTPYDLAWMLYSEIRNAYPSAFQKPFDHQWCLTKCVEAATLQLKEGDKLKKIALSQMDPSKIKN